MPSSLTTVLARHQHAVADFTDADLPSLRQALSAVTDPRKPRGVRYVFTDLLLVFAAAVISGAASLTMIAEWASTAKSRGILPSFGAVPSVATIHRVAGLVDPVAFDAAIGAWIAARIRRGHSQQDAALAAIAIDGKELRGTKHGGGTKTYLMAAMDHATGTVLAQESVGEKTNEIPHFPELISTLGPLKNTVITADAMHTLAQQARAVTDAGGHYLFTVKTNAKTLHTQISQAGWARRKPGYQHREKAHGRISTWSLSAINAPRYVQFPGAAQIIRVHRGREDTSQDTEASTGEFVYAITSLPAKQASPKTLARLIRGHWGIENRLHWVRDTAYREDASQVRKGTTAHLMASLRNLAISIHRLTGQPNITAALRHYARDPELAAELTGL
ncbi:ISAs1 family transposase [Nesterenkonia alkaliphila]|uniref:ISAs1 family transposase n=1 Tax=Nesterenkonia alkaliphila TaxID=1463631 RepID=UPI00166DBE17|nr:ISAs1 family transposase [Nesterenkonia alkaliphila]GFZ93350.1 ISAs1 family transposase [Nesterenkonia alkaliphila]